MVQQKTRVMGSAERPRRTGVSARPFPTGSLVGSPAGGGTGESGRWPGRQVSGAVCLLFLPAAVGTGLWLGWGAGSCDECVAAEEAASPSSLAHPASPPSWALLERKMGDLGGGAGVRANVQGQRDQTARPWKLLATHTERSAPAGDVGGGWRGRRPWPAVADRPAGAATGLLALTSGQQVAVGAHCDARGRQEGQEEQRNPELLPRRHIWRSCGCARGLPLRARLLTVRWECLQAARASVQACREESSQHAERSFARRCQALTRRSASLLLATTLHPSHHPLIGQQQDTGRLQADQVSRRQAAVKAQEAALGCWTDSTRAWVQAKRMSA